MESLKCKRIEANMTKLLKRGKETAKFVFVTKKLKMIL